MLLAGRRGGARRSCALAAGSRRSPPTVQRSPRSSWSPATRSSSPVGATTACPARGARSSSSTREACGAAAGAPVLLTGDDAPRSARVALHRAGARPARARPTGPTTGSRRWPSAVPRRCSRRPGPWRRGGGAAARRPAGVGRPRARRRPGAAAGPRHRRHQPHARRPHRGDARDRDDAPDRRQRQQRRGRHRPRPRACASCSASRGGCDRCWPSSPSPGSSCSPAPSRASCGPPPWARSGCIGLSRSRRSAGPPVLGAAIVVVLVVDPWLARSFGFALSSLATLGLLLFTRPWGDAIGARLPRRLAPLGPALAVPVAAQAMTAPLVVLLQGSVSVVGVLANLLAAPLVPVATVAGVAAVAHLRGVATRRRARRVGRRRADDGDRAGRPAVRRGARRHAAVARRCTRGPAPRRPHRRSSLLTGRALARRRRSPPRARCSAPSSSRPPRSSPPARVTWPPDGWRVVVCDVGQGDAVVAAQRPAPRRPRRRRPRPAARRRLPAPPGGHHPRRRRPHPLPRRPRRRAQRRRLRPPGRAAARRPGPRAGTHRPTGSTAWRGRTASPSPPCTPATGSRVGEVDAVVWSPWRRIADGSVPNNASVVLAAAHRRRSTRCCSATSSARRPTTCCCGCGASRRWPLAAARFEVVKTPHHGSANLDDELMAAVARTGRA